MSLADTKRVAWFVCRNKPKASRPDDYAKQLGRKHRNRSWFDNFTSMLLQHQRERSSTRQWGFCCVAVNQLLRRKGECPWLPGASATRATNLDYTDLPLRTRGKAHCQTSFKTLLWQKGEAITTRQTHLIRHDRNYSFYPEKHQIHNHRLKDFFKAWVILN